MPGSEHEPLAHVAPFMAPVAASQKAVIQDPASLRIAEAIHDAFGDLSSEQGLTRAELAAACSSVAPPEEFDSRFDVFVGLHLLERARGKAHDGRYVFNPISAAALLVFERLGEAGGVEEIMTLLDRTHQDLASGVLGEGELALRLRRARRDLSINTAHLVRLVQSRPIEELLNQHHQHRSRTALLNNAERLVHAIAHDFPALRSAGTRLISEAFRYSAAVDDFYDRLLKQAGTRRDFSMLQSEQYLSAALKASPEALAGVFANVVFDPPTVQATPAAVLQAAEQRRPPVSRRRAPRPAALPPGPNPVIAARMRAEALQQRRAVVMELLLDGQSEVDLTEQVSSLPWRNAIRRVVDVLRASSDPLSLYFVEVSPRVLVDPVGPVTYSSPVTLFRLPQDASAVDERAQAAPEEAP
ncbi:hypothetical protein [Streptomyces phaeochromogenes]|uniref:hypothetical protein n=1 Tax=Streptomyces phaeochromogenes TaxID=1923 RepID=UPI002DDA37FB|nr:hypothetical protein [Streptomyces phaeochromogenes]WRZ34808.1 hypothetical protein OG931_47315 [Streptomyces phaeochromogenes]